MPVSCSGRWRRPHSMLIGWQVGSVIQPGDVQPRNAAIGVVIGAAVGLLLAPLLLTRPYEALRRTVGRMPPGEMIFATIGLVMGLLVAALLSYPLSLLPWSLGHILPAIAAALCAYLGVTFLLMRRRELTQWILGRFGQTRTADADQVKYLVDTNAIIDGRIADVCEAGFLLGQLVVPRFVLNELQHIADSSDSLRRGRGKRGLETLKRLQQGSDSRISISDLDARDVPEVDGKLVKLAHWRCAAP